MGLKDSIKTAVKVVKTEPKASPEQVAEALSFVAAKELNKEPVPKLVFKPSLGLTLTSSDYPCESCDVRDILIHTGKLLLCKACYDKEKIVPLSSDRTIDYASTDKMWKSSIENGKATDELKKDDIPLYAEGMEDDYKKYFVETDVEIAKLTDEELRDYIIEKGKSLFRDKVKQRRATIRLKERAVNKTAEERKKLRLEDLSYIVETDKNLPSPIEEVRKKQAKVEKKDASLKALGFSDNDIAELMKKFKVIKD